MELSRVLGGSPSAVGSLRIFRSATGVVAGLMLAVALAPTKASADAVVADQVDLPALVVMIAIDQLRRDRLDPELPGGLGRLAQGDRPDHRQRSFHRHQGTQRGQFRRLRLPQQGRFH